MTQQIRKGMGRGSIEGKVVGSELWKPGALANCEHNTVLDPVGGSFPSKANLDVGYYSCEHFKDEDGIRFPVAVS